MTALRLQPDLKHAGGPGVPVSLTSRQVWYTASEVCDLLSKSRSQVNRLCQHEWAPRGLAEQRPSPHGPKSWFVAAGAHPRLRRAHIETRRDGRSTVTELLAEAGLAKRSDAEARAHIVIAFRRWRSGLGCHALSESSRQGVQPPVIARDYPVFAARMEQQYGLRLSLRRVQQLDQACPASDDFAGIVVRCLDSRGRPSARDVVCSDVAWSRFCALYLTPNQWSVAKCHRTVEAEADANGWSWPSRRTVLNLIKERLTPEMICLKREGNEAWSKRFETPIGQDANAWAAGECWEADHARLDFFIRVFREGRWTHARPWLTAWFDRRSRRAMGWGLSMSGNSATIRQAMLQALRTDGVSVPSSVWLDNGKDFAAAALTGATKHERRTLSPAEREQIQREACGLLTHLGIDGHFAVAYNHNGKARIERWFGTVHGDFDREWPSYAGYDAAELDKMERAERLENVMDLPTIEQVREKFATWFESYNHRADHAIDDLVDPDTRQRLSPIEFYDRFLPAMRVVRADSLILLEQVFTRPLTVHKWGVSLKIAGKVVRYGEHSVELRELMGSHRQVRVSYDESDLRSVRVFDEDWRLICIARENGRHGGLSDDPIRREDLQAAMNTRRQIKRDLKRQIDTRSMSLSDAELTSDMARKREVEQTKARIAEQRKQANPGELAPLRLVSTPVDQVDAEQVLKQAAGAEVSGTGFQPVGPSVIDLLAQEVSLGGTARRAVDGPSVLDAFLNCDATADDGEVEGRSVIALLARDHREAP